MNTLEFLFWLLFGIILYVYIGYGILLLVLVSIKKMFSKESDYNEEYEPEVTLFVAAYNEKDFIEQKIQNSFQQNYPPNKIKHIWITDGSNDASPEILKKYKEVEIYHNPERKGKIDAINRGMKFVTTPIVIFSDANTMLGENSIREIVHAFRNRKVGCVAGEKRVVSNTSDSAAGSGEGVYWKYESMLKKLDSELNSVVGAAGELFAIRTALFEEVEKDTILDDFIISLRIIQKGYKIKYMPQAYAKERASANVQEEMKRKIRISAGSFQSIARLKALLNPIKYGVISFQYISHKVLRWLIVPLALFFILPLNFTLTINNPFVINLYSTLFYLQILFYCIVLIGWRLQHRKIKFKILFLPYYLFMMNLSQYLGFFRYLKGKQTVNWERAKRG